MKIVRESLNEIKQNKENSGLGSINIGKAATHGKYFDTIKLLMPDALNQLIQQRKKLEIYIMETFNDGNYILNEVSRLLECNHNNMLIAVANINIPINYQIDAVDSIAATFINSAYEMYEDAANCVLSYQNKNEIISILKELDLEYKKIPIKNKHDKETWIMRFFPKLRVVCIQANPDVDFADPIIIFC